MLKDKVNFIKSNEACIAHINSLKERIKDISTINLLNLAESFIMYKTPYIKENKTLEIKTK